MRIKIIGDNNCARATRHLLRKAGFAVTEFLPANVVTQAPHSGYVIAIDLAPAPHATSGRTLEVNPDPSPKPDHPTHGQSAPAIGEALPSHGTASSPALPGAGGPQENCGAGILPAGLHVIQIENRRRDAGITHSASIHFDSVDSELEGAILRHVTQLAAAPVVVDRPGGLVHSDRELRIVVPHSGDAKADEAAAVAVEFGVLRGLLDLASPPSLPKHRGASADKTAWFSRLTGKAPWFWRAKVDNSAVAPGSSRSGGGNKWWRFFSRAAYAVLALAGSLHASPRYVSIISRAALPASGRASAARATELVHGVEERRADASFGAERTYLLPATALAAQGQFSTGQAPVKITDGTNTLVVDPCKAQTKFYVSISQTANTQLVTGTASKKIYICSIHVVVAVVTNVALVEGTGSVCATGTAGVSGFGGATAATGWNFAANGGIALGNGDAAVGAEGTNADNLCLFNSGSGQVSGGISYVVQ
jgi:hypothetical protein